jgi:transposase
LANELGINVERIYKWRTASKPTEGLQTGQAIHLDPQVVELKKQLKESQLELEILKKAVHIFSKSDG